MKKLLILFLILTSIVWIACNSSSEKKEADKDSAAAAAKPKSPEDSLMAVIIEGHDVGMNKMGKLRSANTRIQAVLDSIAKLPAKTKKALEPYKAKLEISQKNVKDAMADMDKWMENFQFDSKDEKYLRQEKTKVSAIKDNILNGIRQADSLLKAKF